ncbi:MAG: hypothetical protein OSJ43_17340 [Oscillospiraceae bacterium]|nr:hypothetical protein [Oscillospiraceae bacterium]
MTEKFDYNSKTYIGASDEDIKIIHLVLVDGKRLTMDKRGRIYDESGRWIANGKERNNA